MGAKIRNPNELHGKVVVLKRDGKDVKGILMAQDARSHSNNFAFKWTDSTGVKIDAVSDTELQQIRTEDSKPVEQISLVDGKKEVKKMNGKLTKRE